MLLLGTEVINSSYPWHVRVMFTLQNLNRFSELNGIKVIHLFEGALNQFSFELVQTASGNAKGINAKSH